MKNSVDNQITSFDPREVAKQLTLRDSELFAMVEPREYISYLWREEDETGNKVSEMS